MAKSAIYSIQQCHTFYEYSSPSGLLNNPMVIPVLGVYKNILSRKVLKFHDNSAVRVSHDNSAPAIAPAMLFVLQKYACSLDLWLYAHRCSQISLTVLKIGTNKVFEHFFDFYQSQEIGDVSTGHGYKIFIPFPFLTFFPHSQ